MAFPGSLETARFAAAMLFGMSCPSGPAAGPAAGPESGPGSTPTESRGCEPLTLRVNSFTSSDQSNASLGVLPDGTVVVAWESRRQDRGTYGVYARAVSPDGTALSPEVRVNTWTPGAQHRPAVGAGPDGSAWIAWTSLGQDGDAGAVMARRFGSGLEDGTAEVRVNQSPSGNQHAPAIAPDDSGGALVVWIHEAPPDSRVHARLMGWDGVLQGDERCVSTGSGRDSVACVTLDPRFGGFVVAWARADSEGRPLGLVWRRVDDGGAPAGPERWLDGCGGVEPSLGVDAEGRLVAAWMAGGDDGYSVRARWFDAAGAPLGDAVTIADASAGTASGAAVAVGPSGGQCLVAYNLADPGDGKLSIRMSEFGAGGVIGTPRRLLAGHGDQRLACAGGVHLVWARRVLSAAWSGDAGLDDPTAAHVTFAPADLAEPVSRGLSPAESGAVAQAGVSDTPGPEDLPPSWDPAFRPQGALEAQAAVPGMEFGFEGVPGTPWSPPDPGLAVGPGHVVAIVNGQIAFFDKGGTCTHRQAIGNEGDPGFWETVGSGNFVFDPEALYDPWSGRYWVMACERMFGSYFDIAVSDDGDPNGEWHKYRISVTALASNDIDSPNFAVDGEAVYLAADFFAGGDKHLLYMLPKAPLLAGLAAPAGISHMITGSQSYGLARSAGGAAPAQYLLHAAEQATNTTITVHALRDALTAPTRVSFVLPVAAYQFPGSPLQLGSSVGMVLFEPRFWSCVYRSATGSIWAAHHVRTPASGGRAVVRWYEIATNGWPVSAQDPAVRQWGEIDAGTGLHAYFPSIGVDASGETAAITFARSGVSEFIGMWRAVRRGTDAPGTFRPAMLVRASSSPYTAYARWGDYSATEIDPVGGGCTLWGHHEFATAPNLWRTWVGRYRVFARTDLSEDCALTVEDFGVFQNLFQSGDPRCDFDGSGTLSVGDFGAFQTAFVAGQ